jgi:hypothetical protein
MSDPLAVYLHDHLAGSAFAIDLLESLRDHYSNDPLGELASKLLVEVDEDRNALQGIANRIGKESSGLREAGAWLAEKATRIKLSHDEAKGLGTFQALETLGLGILGKLALWRTLMVVAETDDRLRDVDFEQLVVRAQAQYAKTEEGRLLLARQTFS